MAPQGRLSSLAFGGLFLLYHEARSVGVASLSINTPVPPSFLLFIILSLLFHIGHFVVIVLRMTQ